MVVHVAFVMDGNRRWAEQQGFESWRGHREGVESLRRVIDFCLLKKIPYASFYTFSLENFKRSEEEKSYLFKLIIEQADSQLPIFLEKKARVRFVGDRAKFPNNVRKICERIEDATRMLSTINLNFLFCYGARQEMVDAVKKVVTATKEGRFHEEDISQELLNDLLWTRDLPEPDLIIRTGGVKRLSNFLLYQAAYSEIYFMDCLWPEITTHHLEAALLDFQTCTRNFGI
jgi:undecaprenyl diphosphate synthase